MINEKCFTRDWIDSFKRERVHRAIQAPILEKMIWALHLLEHLKVNGLDFVFKGGTSLILLLEEGNRFSIDIDIICSAEREDLEKVLDTIVETSNFIKVELDKKRSYNEGIPKAHYIFEFDSVYNPNVPGKILLDVLIEAPLYPELIDASLDTKWIETDKENTIVTPSVDSITGDKLTAFAPNTIGIPYYKGTDSFAMEICKQLFDLSKLFPNISNMEIVHESFYVFAQAEIEYRTEMPEFKEKELTPETVLQDTIDTCLLIARREGNKTEPYKSQFTDLNTGIKAFGSNFLMSGNFRIDDAVIASARVAYLATKLLVGKLNPIQYYDGSDVKKLAIAHPDFAFLNKLKRQPDKSSFYYWYHTVQLLTN